MRPCFRVICLSSYARYNMSSELGASARCHLLFASLVTSPTAFQFRPLFRASPRYSSSRAHFRSDPKQGVPVPYISAAVWQFLIRQCRSSGVSLSHITATSPRVFHYKHFYSESCEASRSAFTALFHVPRSIPDRTWTLKNTIYQQYIRFLGCQTFHLLEQFHEYYNFEQYKLK